MAKYFTYNNQEVSVGDTVRVAFNVAEGDKTRQQMFEGIIIAVDNREAGKAFTIRKIAAGGIGVERIVPVGSPALGNIEILAKGDVRRAKLFYMRDRIGRQAMKIKKKINGTKVQA
ncbi:MAG: 50S ribosomal protein L19 [Candidatus Woesebacteria bacterium]